ncbi:hypothetical protein PEC730217_36750 [Pectobacterium carotovorum subsp. carotovorum]|uniref:hypothetical protein n=1 Tax=Pectobacterium TaxID=122277 RepID=UPI0020885690|nr:hypothetical protein [Pectobacterium sp. HCp5_1]GKW34895.1 hypothetical protein PEC730217_36750 [Pectobacterium carotovorum subsp. carotovorum]
MTDLSPLDAWLRVGTWDTGHPKDSERFYKAVYAVIKLNDAMIERKDVYLYIIDHQKGKVHKNRLDELAEKYSSKFSVIVDFLYENKISL